MGYVRGVLFLLFVAVAASIYLWQDNEERSGTVATNDVVPTLEISGNGPGEWSLKFQTEPPVYVACTQWEIADDTFDALLTDVGRELFETPDDVQQALSDAVGQAVSAMAADTIGTTGIVICEDDDNTCYLDSWTGSATENDADVSAELWWSVGDSPYDSPYNNLCGDPETDPSTLTSDSQLRKTLELSITAPRAPGVNLRPLIESLDLDNFPAGAGSTAKSNFVALISELLDDNLVVTPDSTTSLQKTVSSGSVRVTFPTPTLVVYFEVGFTGIFAHYDSVTGDFTSGSTVSAVSKSADGYENLFGPDYPADPGMFPSSISLTNQDNSDLTITKELTITNLAGPGTDHWALYPFYEPSNDLRFTSTGYLVQASSSYQQLISDPATLCQHSYEYVNRYPAIKLATRKCPIEMQLKTDSEIGYVFPVGKPPKCKIYLWGEPPEA